MPVVARAPAPRVTLPVVATDRRAVPVHGIMSRDDLFRCREYKCTLSAGSCVDRQAAACGGGTGKRDFANGRGESTGLLGHCRDCGQGREVAAQLDR